MTQEPTIGQRVRFTRPLDRYPHFIVQAGEEGTVHAMGVDYIDVKMDRHIPEADEWDNCAVFSGDDGWELAGEDDAIPDPAIAFRYYTETI